LIDRSKKLFNIDGLVQNSDAILAGFLGSLFAGITGEQGRLYVRLLAAAIVDHLKSCVLLFQRIIAQQEIEITAPESCERLNRRDGSFDIVAFLRQYQTISREHRTLVVHYQNRRFVFSRHRQFLQ